MQSIFDEILETEKNEPIHGDRQENAGEDISSLKIGELREEGDFFSYERESIGSDDIAEEVKAEDIGGGESDVNIGGMTSEATSELVTDLFNMLLGRLGGSISGESYQVYEMDNLEKRQVKKAFKIYIESLPPAKRMSPLQALLLVLAGVSGATAFKAFRNKKRNKGERKERMQQRDRARKGEAVDVEFSEVEVYDFEFKMGRFQVDAKGFYIYDENRDHINQDERTRKPSPTVRDLIDEGLSGPQIKNHLKKISKNG